MNLRIRIIAFFATVMLAACAPAVKVAPATIEQIQIISPTRSPASLDKTPSQIILPTPPATTPTNSLRLLSVSAGAKHTCGLEPDGSIICWGSDQVGQLQVPKPNNDFTQVSAGGSLSCGLKHGGSIVCWGDNENGQTRIPDSNSEFTQVSAGAAHVCGLKGDGSIVCWGNNSDGQTRVSEPNRGFTQVSAGTLHTCGLKSTGSIICWGSDRVGQIQVPDPDTDFIQVSAGGSFTCGLKRDGRIVCWVSSSDIPSPNSGFTQVSAGGGHACGLKNDGNLVCWGDDLSYGETTVPTSENNFTQVSVGDAHNCGLKSDGGFLCWGNNQYGQLSVPPTPTQTAFTGATAPDDHFATEDAFGDSYISRISINDVNGLSQGDLMRRLVTQWLEHYKTQNNPPNIKMKDYKLGEINFMKNTYDPFFQWVAGVRFSIIPAQIPNEWASFPGDQIEPGDVWWNLGAAFGVFKDGDMFRLRLVTGWGT